MNSWTMVSSYLRIYIKKQCEVHPSHNLRFIQSPQYTTSYASKRKELLNKAQVNVVPCLLNQQFLISLPTASTNAEVHQAEYNSRNPT